MRTIHMKIYLMEMPTIKTEHMRMNLMTTTHTRTFPMGIQATWINYTATGCIPTSHMTMYHMKTYRIMTMPTGPGQHQAILTVAAQIRMAIGLGMSMQATAIIRMKILLYIVIGRIRIRGRIILISTTMIMRTYPTKMWPMKT